MTSNSLFQIHENLAIDVYFMGVFIKCIFLIVVLVSDTRREQISFKKLQALDSYIKKSQLTCNPFSCGAVCQSVRPASGRLDVRIPAATYLSSKNM